jgi:nucleotide-binding universal stress UspA family protein
MYQIIVVGAHKSESARRAADQALTLARAFGAEVHLVTAYAKDGEPLDGKDTPARVDAQRSLDAMVPAGGIPKVTTHALPGDPTKAILSVAQEVGADLIVIGNRGMKGKGRVLGSVPNSIAHQARCAVLVVPSS